MTHDEYVATWTRMEKLAAVAMGYNVQEASVSIKDAEAIRKEISGSTWELIKKLNEDGGITENINDVITHFRECSTWFEHVASNVDFLPEMTFREYFKRFHFDPIKIDSKKWMENFQR